MSPRPGDMLGDLRVMLAHRLAEGVFSLLVVDEAALGEGLSRGLTGEQSGPDVSDITRGLRPAAPGTARPRESAQLVSSGEQFRRELRKARADLARERRNQRGKRPKGCGLNSAGRAGYRVPPPNNGSDDGQHGSGSRDSP